MSRRLNHELLKSRRLPRLLLARLAELDAVNISTALHRLARLSVAAPP